MPSAKALAGGHDGDGRQRRAFAVGLVRLILDLVVLHPFQPAVQQD
ncbi:hypothetical protein [uncultured Gemmiger sp.]|nr:hypothetical protein [uncultured Gemmiger sp.]